MPAPIVVDVGTPEPQRDLASALIDACTQAAASINTECRLVRDAPSGPYAAIAIVTWEEGDRARVEVGIRREPVSEWRMRELTFQSADAEIERFRSVGFVIGSLTTAASDEAASTKQAEPAPPPEPPPPPLPVPKPTRKAQPAPAETPSPGGHGWVGIAGMIGGGLDRGPARYGAELGVGVRVLPHLSVVLTGGASTRGRDGFGLVPTWLNAGVGLGVTLGPPRAFRVDVRSLAIAERFSAVVTHEGHRDESSRTTPGWLFGVDAVVPLVDLLDVVVGGEATLRPATRVHVEGNANGATRNLELGATAGFRFEL